MPNWCSCQCEHTIIVADRSITELILQIQPYELMQFLVSTHHQPTKNKSASTHGQLNAESVWILLDFCLVCCIPSKLWVVRSPISMNATWSLVNKNGQTKLVCCTRKYPVSTYSYSLISLFSYIISHLVASWTFSLQNADKNHPQRQAELNTVRSSSYTRLDHWDILDTCLAGGHTCTRGIQEEEPR